MSKQLSRRKFIPFPAVIGLHGCNGLVDQDGNEPMFSSMPAAIATRVGLIRPAIVFEMVIYAPLRMRHRAYCKLGSVPSS